MFRLLGRRPLPARGRSASPRRRRSPRRLILPRVATRGGAAIAHVLDSKTSQPIRSAYPVGLTWVTLHASGSAAKHRVERALDTGGPTVQHVRVDLGRGHVSVPEQLLDGSDVAPVLEQ